MFDIADVPACRSIELRPPTYSAAVPDDDAFRAMESRLAGLLPRLNERDRRLALATEARSWGRGGIAAVHRATGASRSTIRRGLAELDNDPPRRPNRVRAPGGGRKKAEVADPELLDRLDSLIEPGTRGDPESPLRWTTKSTRHLARELTAMGHDVSHSVVAKILRSNGFSLQGTRKTPRRRPAPRPGRPVPLHQLPRRAVPGRRRAGDQRRYQEKGVGRTVHPGRAGVAAPR